jgi:hypothetical protein
MPVGSDSRPVRRMGLIEDVGGEPKLRRFEAEEPEAAPAPSAPPAPVAAQGNEGDLIIPDDEQDATYDTPAFLRQRLHN